MQTICWQLETQNFTAKPLTSSCCCFQKVDIKWSLLQKLPYSFYYNSALEHLVNCTVHEVLIVKLVQFNHMAVVSGAPLKGNPELWTLSYSGHFLG